MSQMVTRKRTGGDEKDKGTDSPVKEMKKKMAANAEKEKNAAEQANQTAAKPVDKPADKPTAKSVDRPADKPTAKPVDRPADKPVDKSSAKPADRPSTKPADKPSAKPAEKPADKPSDKSADKTQKTDKAPEKPAEKKSEKPVEKKDGPSEKKKEENGKGESSGKTDKTPRESRPKQNGSNGVNGTVSPSPDSSSDETELFPELAYDDSDVEWEPGMDRSLTRRSQVKATRTPETPRPASDKQETGDESKDSNSKVLKLNQEAVKAADTKPDSKKAEAKPDGKKPETPKKQDAPETPKGDAKKDVKESPKKADEKKEQKSDKVEIEVVVEIESSSEPSEESRKPDTNFSKSRVKVSPYRRSMRLADQTASSIAANYTGNNTTMEMDITETSSFMEESMDDSYLSGLRSIKGRRSYKLLKDMPPRAANRSVRSVANTTATVSEQASRPTAPVVGRKRKPEPEDNVSVASEATEPAAGKRQRLLERLARPFRRAALLPARRNAEIVGINTDLPLTAPVASTALDPERLKPALSADPGAPRPAAEAPAVSAPLPDDAKRCVVM